MNACIPCITYVLMYACMDRCVHACTGSAEVRQAHLRMIGEWLSSEETELRWAACDVFGAGTAKERQPYLDKIDALLEDEDVDVRWAACDMFSKCSAEERQPYLDKIGALLGDEDVT